MAVWSKIAGICNKEHNVFGLMPHPEGAVHTKSINTDSPDNSSQNAMGIAMLVSLYNEA